MLARSCALSLRKYPLKYQPVLVRKNVPVGIHCHVSFLFYPSTEIQVSGNECEANKCILYSVHGSRVPALPLVLGHTSRESVNHGSVLNLNE